MLGAGTTAASRSGEAGIHLGLLEPGLRISAYLLMVKTSLGGAAVVKGRLPVGQPQWFEGITVAKGWIRGGFSRGRTTIGPSE